MKALGDMDIPYKHEVSVVRNDNDNWLRMDFEIKYDGIQHFKPVKHFGGQVKFEKCKLHDQLKNKWCEELRIPYTQFGNVAQLITEFITTHTDWDGDH